MCNRIHTTFNYEEMTTIILLCIIIIFLIFISISLFKITQKQNQMSDETKAIKQDLIDTKALVVNVKADVDRLHEKIDALDDQSTKDDIAEIKALSADLKASLKDVDDATPEETPAP